VIIKDYLNIHFLGKTSTFNIITNETYANSGRATIQGVDVAESPVIGYCPQFGKLIYIY
jgi:ABC-type multidrug transport system ATPase subunit